MLSVMFLDLQTKKVIQFNAGRIGYLQWNLCKIRKTLAPGIVVEILSWQTKDWSGEPGRALVGFFGIDPMRGAPIQTVVIRKVFSFYRFSLILPLWLFHSFLLFSLPVFPFAKISSHRESQIRQRLCQVR